MKKTIQKIVACCIATISLLSATACSCKNIVESGKDNATKIPEKDAVFTVDNSANHVVKYSETTQKIVDNGKSDYVIVIPENSTLTEDEAAREFKLLFYRATGIYLPIKKDNEVIYSNQLKAISIGETKYLSQANINLADYDLEWEGYIIKTVGSTVFIAGGEAQGNGSIFGVYGFMELEFEYETFHNDYDYIRTGNKDVALRNYEVKEIPDFRVRTAGDTMINNFPETVQAMRYTPRSEAFIGTTSVHTYFHYVSPSLFDNPDDPDNYHPEWFTDNGEQLCLQAHGNQEEYEALQNRALEMIILGMKENPKGKIFVWGQQDVSYMCDCAVCKPYYDEYNTNAVVPIMFCNDLSDRVKAWFETEEGKAYEREFYISFLAYGTTVNAPATYNENTGEYTAQISCRDNVVALYAPISMDTQESIFHEKNAAYYHIFQAWKAVSKGGLNVYYYRTNYAYFLTPFESISSMQEHYQYLFNDSEVLWFFDLGQYQQERNQSCWGILKNYLSARLSWNVNENMEELINRFFDKMYGPASGTMKEFFKNWMAFMNYAVDEYAPATKTTYQKIYPATCFTLPLLECWREYTNRALEDLIEIQLSDPEYYQLCYDHVTAERVGADYLILMLHEKKLDANYLHQLRLEMKTDCVRLGITHHNEAVTSVLSDYWLAWGV